MSNDQRSVRLQPLSLIEKHLVSTIVLISGIPLILIDGFVSDGTLLFFGLAFFLSPLCFIVLKSSFNSQLSLGNFRIFQVIVKIFSLIMWGVIFVPYHELIHFFSLRTDQTNNFS